MPNATTVCDEKNNATLFFTAVGVVNFLSGFALTHIYIDLLYAYSFLGLEFLNSTYVILCTRFVRIDCGVTLCRVHQPQLYVTRDLPFN